MELITVLLKTLEDVSQRLLGGNLVTQSITKQLRTHLEDAEPWEQMETPIVGATVIKMAPTKKFPKRIALALNPIKEDGTKLKKRGIYLFSVDELSMFRKLVLDSRLGDILKSLEEVNPDEVRRKTLAM